MITGIITRKHVRYELNDKPNALGDWYTRPKEITQWGVIIGDELFWYDNLADAECAWAESKRISRA